MVVRTRRHSIKKRTRHSSDRTHFSPLLLCGSYKWFETVDHTHLSPLLSCSSSTNYYQPQFCAPPIQIVINHNSTTSLGKKRPSSCPTLILVHKMRTAPSLSSYFNVLLCSTDEVRLSFVSLSIAALRQSCLEWIVSQNNVHPAKIYTGQKLMAKNRKCKIGFLCH